jgi:hypothetical protein
VQIHDDHTHIVPPGVPPGGVVRWDFPQIVGWLRSLA